MSVSTAVICTLIASLALASDARGLSITFDYGFDTNGFFDAPERRERLEQAGRRITDSLTDDLDALDPTGTDSWTARFTHPSTGDPAAVSGISLASDTLLVFVGARDLGTNTLGSAAPGTASVIGSQDWFDTVRYRGELGAADSPATDFGPWGGFISFDLDASWFFGPSSAGLAPEEFDFLSAATHELTHVLGFGVSDSWRASVLGPSFTGAAALSEFGGPIPLSSDLKHWAEGTLGLVDGQSQAALMGPALPSGERRGLTGLDYAGLTDVGWMLVPEPGTGLLLLLGLALVEISRRADTLGQRRAVISGRRVPPRLRVARQTPAAKAAGCETLHRSHRAPPAAPRRS